MSTMVEPDIPSTDLDLFDPALRASPFAAYAQLREAGPLLRRYPSTTWSRYAEAAAVLLDPRGATGTRPASTRSAPGSTRPPCRGHSC